MFAHANTCKKKPQEINFVCLSTKEISCIFQTCYIVSILLSTKCQLFHNFELFCSNNIVFINQVLKFKYQPRHLQVKYQTNKNKELGRFCVVYTLNTKYKIHIEI